METTTRDAVAGELRSIAARRNISQVEIAKRLGVTQMWLSRRMRAVAGITVDDLTNICDVLDVDAAEVLARATATTADLAP